LNPTINNHSRMDDPDEVQRNTRVGTLQDKKGTIRGILLPTPFLFFFVFLRKNGFPYDKNTERYPALPNLNLPLSLSYFFLCFSRKKGFPFEMYSEMP
jgi:hypothetical protein